MRLSTAVALALMTLLVAFAVGAAVVAPATATPAPERTSALPSTTSGSTTVSSLEASVQDAGGGYDPERADTWQVFRLNVTDSGDVRWTIESRFIVPENETDDFEAYAEAVANGDRPGGYNVEQYDEFRAKAEHSTGREMSLENANWEEPRIESLEGTDGSDRKLGIISYSFTWTNFAVIDDQRIRLGDAFVTDDGVWFPVLEAGQRLVVESPPNYGVETAPSGIRDGTVVRDGHATLNEEDFQIVFLHSGGANGPGPESEPLITPIRVGAVLGSFALVLVVASLAISRYQRSKWPFEDWANHDLPHNSTQSAETDGSGPSMANASNASTDARGVEHEFHEIEAISAAGPDDDGTDEEDEVDVDLLSDEERVRRLLERNGGRMKQATIVKETGWSDAKVSQLLSEMDDDDEIEKLRIGRENLITLPDVDPTELD